MIVLEGQDLPPDGTVVSVRVLKNRSRRSKQSGRAKTIYDELKPFVGTARGLPPDASRNVDHYLYGKPKQQS